MATLPILFKGPLVRAILRDVDPKTQTRRLITRLRGFGKVREFGRSDTRGYDWTFRGHRGTWNDISDKRLREVLPYQVGDRLWVRETIVRRPPPNDDFSMFAADGMPTKADCWPWKKNVLTSIHCPRGLSRIDLEITDVRIQQVKGITEADAIAEGATAMVDERGERRWRIDWSRLGKLSEYASGVPRRGDERPLTVGDIGLGSARMAFANVWHEVNGERASWDSNPWVLAITFRRVLP